MYVAKVRKCGSAARSTRWRRAFLSGPWPPPGTRRQAPGNPRPQLERHLQHMVLVHHDFMAIMMIYVLMLMNVGTGHGR